MKGKSLSHKRIAAIAAAALILTAGVLVYFLWIKEKAPEAVQPTMFASEAATSPLEEKGILPIRRQMGDQFYPDEKKWVYHFSYAYPQATGEDYTAALINDTYDMALNEWSQLVLPMFANAEDMRYDGHNEVVHDFRVTCNDGKLLSILQSRVQTRGENESPLYALEPLTFDVGGLYAGQTLTLRGVTLIQAGVDGKMLDDVEPELYPDVAHIVDGSSDEMAEALLPVLYREFQRLQEAGVMGKTFTEQDFLAECSPDRDFYADDAGHIVFFLPPMLMAEPSLATPTVSFTPEELDTMLAETL